MAKVLLIEDDPDVVTLLTIWFQEQGDLLEVSTSGEDALQLLRHFNFDIILMDWGLPGMPGIEVLKKYRESGGLTPIIFLTSRAELNDKETGLDTGADDYLVKPIQPRELSARIRSVLRRPSALLPSNLQVGAVALDPRTRIATINGAQITLAPKECALLEYLMRHPNCAFSAQQLLAAVWPSESESSVGSVRSWMRILRQKLGAAGETDYIRTVGGSGYLVALPSD